MACECRRASWYSLEIGGGGPKGKEIKKGLKAVDKAGLPEVEGKRRKFPLTWVAKFFWRVEHRSGRKCWRGGH